MALIDVVMPQLGESIAEGTIARWLKAVGDPIAEDEPLLEVSTDKVDAEIPSVSAGRIAEILFAEGDTVEIQTVIARIENDASASLTAGSPRAATPPATAPAAAPVAPSTPAAAPTPAAPPAISTLIPQASVAPQASAAPAPSSDPLTDRRRTLSSPLVRNIAKEHGVVIAMVPGTGIDGRVSKADIVAYIERGEHLRTLAPTPAAALPPLPRQPVVPPGAAVAGASSMPADPTPMNFPPVPVYPGDRVEPMSKMRTSICEHMARSTYLAAHVQTGWEVDMSNVMRLRKAHKEAAALQGVKLSVTSFILKATAMALRQHPMLNAALSGNNIIYRGAVNLGCAVSVDDGLMVPVIKNADTLTVRGIAAALSDIAVRARSKRLSLDELQGSTFSVTNPGVFGSLWGTPVINQPNVAILGCGKTEDRVCAVDGMVAIRPKAYYVLSFDHRLVNGSDADQFMATFKQALETMDESAL
jgi:pyruvate dehydrogenase E2 component (dihydrolipoamide acetyltransferase)